MAVAVSDHFSFISGCVQDRYTLRVIAQADALSDAGKPNSTLMKWILPAGKRYDFHLARFMTRIATMQSPKLHVLSIGPEGHVNVGTSEGDHQEEIDGSDAGPSHNGDIRDLRLIGHGLYAVGMGRQVYRREGPDHWVHKDAGALQVPSTDEVVGFNAIDGVSEDDIFAVGFGGEIWRRHDDRWREIRSPTNVILNCIKSVRPDLLFIGGQKGTLIKGHGDTWSVVSQSVIEDQIWGLEWFNNALYLATDNSVFRLLDDDELKIVHGKGKRKRTCGSLHSRDGIMLSVGRKHISWTNDGDTWHDIV